MFLGAAVSLIKRFLECLLKDQEANNTKLNNDLITKQLKLFKYLKYKGLVVKTKAFENTYFSTCYRYNSIIQWKQLFLQVNDSSVNIVFNICRFEI